MLVKVKICGITRKEDLDAAVRAGADALGFVVGVEKSHRNLSTRAARELMDLLPSDIDSVAVTVFDRPHKIMDICQQLRPCFMQLHGITPELSRENRQAFDTRLIVAVNAKSPHALESAVSHSESADTLLVDSNRPDGLGGTGCTHDWNLSRKIREAIYPVPMILAGGLTPQNVSHAIRMVRPYGVDVSTGVESRPGIKDPAKIAEFVKKAKEAVS
jgi:phosphoribosylanthranilate isomerase